MNIIPAHSAAFIMSHDAPSYGSGIVRSQSPTASLNTVYGPDETEEEDFYLSEKQFSEKVLDQIRIGYQTNTERWNEAMPIRFPSLQAGSEEERRETDGFN
jgi:hypothetical protein